ncbi:hypothetical protein, partial [Helicobacter heilmannii]|uniref:hypothetical protein n=1 Tax=Helicobacter heilmannii TaxID=35817 RepID=UPI001E65C449
MCNLILDFRNFGYNNPCGQARLKRAPKVVNIAEWVRKPLKPQGLSVTSYGFLLSREYPTTFPAPQTKLKALRYAKYPKVSPYGIQWPYYSKVCNLILDFRNFGYNNPC